MTVTDTQTMQVWLRMVTREPTQISETATTTLMAVRAASMGLAHLCLV